MVRLLLTLPVVMIFGGCAAPSLYQWGGYDQALYAGYKDATKMEAMRLKLESHIIEMEKSGQKVAPGLYAELGTLYLQSGEPDKAVVFYSREHEAWAESRGLMTAMIRNLERRKQAPGDAEK